MDKKDTISDITVSALKAGDERAFEEVYRQFSGRLYGKLLKLVKSEYVAQELLQEIFLKVWEKRDQIDPYRPFRAYLFRIAENQAYDFFRKAARDKKLQKQLLSRMAEDPGPAEEALIREERNDMLQQAIAALPLRRRQVFRLCKLEGQSYEKVSVELGISTSTISDHIVKATRFIREYYHLHDEILLILCISILFTGF